MIAVTVEAAAMEPAVKESVAWTEGGGGRNRATTTVAMVVAAAVVATVAGRVGVVAAVTLPMTSNTTTFSMTIPSVVGEGPMVVGAAADPVVAAGEVTVVAAEEETAVADAANHHPTISWSHGECDRLLAQCGLARVSP